MYSIFAILALASHVTQPTELTDIASRLAGTGAHACGISHLEDNVDNSISCVRKNMSSGKPFWIAIQLQGEDSYIWRAAAQSRDRKRWIIKFDSDISGGSANPPKLLFEIIPCNDLTISSHKRAEISCSNNLQNDSRR